MLLDGDKAMSGNWGNALGIWIARWRQAVGPSRPKCGRCRSDQDVGGRTDDSSDDDSASRLVIVMVMMWVYCG